VIFLPSYILTVLDTCSIQEYVFGANNLRQIVGASFLVERLLKGWVAESLPDPNNLQRVELGTGGWDPHYTDLRIERDNLAAELVYAGGGNAVVIFDTLGRAQDFARRLTARVIREAPGLKLALAHSIINPGTVSDASPATGSKGFNWERDSIAKIYDSVMAELFRKKQNQPPVFILPGLSVAASCAYTGHPAVIHENEVSPRLKDARPLSREARAKLNASDEAGTRLRGYLGDIGGYDLVSDFNDIGYKGERSTMAVVHIDGNGMGQRFKNIGDRFTETRGWIQAMRDLSLDVQKAVQDATVKTVRLLLKSIGPDGLIGGKVAVKNHLPFRPVISGGDDVTFVCDGRLALDLAVNFLKALESRTLCDGQALYARAGVAVVKTHYPFSHAYRLAEELCASVKKRLKEVNDENLGEAVSGLDWHFAAGGRVNSLSETRKREYLIKDQNGQNHLEARPLLMDKGGWRNWETFCDIIDHFTNDPDWSDRRNKVKALREVLRQGPDQTGRYLKSGAMRLPGILGYEDMPSRGWQGGYCGYFDAIEAMDDFVRLGEGRN
jgi:hypothetical protein